MALREEIRQTRPFTSPAAEAYLALLRTELGRLRDALPAYGKLEVETGGIFGRFARNAIANTEGTLRYLGSLADYLGVPGWPQR